MQHPSMQNSVEKSPWLVTEPGVMDTDRYLSSANAPDLEEDARLCILSGERNMVLNCGALTYLTAAGLRTFLKIARMMQDVEGSLTIQDLKGQPREIFMATGMESFVPVVEGSSLSRYHPMRA